MAVKRVSTTKQKTVRLRRVLHCISLSNPEPTMRLAGNIHLEPDLGFTIQRLRNLSKSLSLIEAQLNALTDYLTLPHMPSNKSQTSKKVSLKDRSK